MFKVFKDFDKASADILSEDFDCKYTLKVKSKGPYESTLTTNTTYENSKNPASLSSKVSVKYPHSSGFTLEKLEIANNGSVSAETSLSGTTQGLLLEFKGNDCDKSEISFKYEHPQATFTGLADVLKMEKAEVSVSSGRDQFKGGLSACFGKPFTLNSTTYGLGYTVNKVFDASIRADAKKSLVPSVYKGLFKYTASNDITLAGEVKYEKDASFALAGVYNCNPTTVLKLKATSCGKLFASAKQDIAKVPKCSAVACAQFDNGLQNPKFGLNITLG